MAKVANLAASKVLGHLTAPAGLDSQVAALAQAERIELAGIPARQVRVENAALPVAERAIENKYPLVKIYCEKVVNQLREKFRTFSGQAHLAVEIRFSQDRLEELESKLQLYVDAFTNVLDQNRGDWGDGMFFGGGYEAVFGPVKQGGVNFIQIAKITFELEVSS